MAEEDASLTGSAVGGRTVNVAAAVGAGNVAVAALDAAICVGVMTVSGPGTQADHIRPATLTKRHNMLRNPGKNV